MRLSDTSITHSPRPAPRPKSWDAFVAQLRAEYIRALLETSWLPSSQTEGEKP